jgi:hypothetical protein
MAFPAEPNNDGTLPMELGAAIIDADKAAVLDGATAIIEPLVHALTPGTP